MPRAHLPVLTHPTFLAALASFGLLAGCTGVTDGQSPMDNMTGAGVSNGQAGGAVGGSPTTGGSSSGAGGSGSGTTVMPDPTCAGSDLPAAKRIVRLSFNQVANSIGSLINQALGTKIVTDFELLDSEHRAFPPLSSPREGNSVTDQSWSVLDRVAQAAGQYVFDNFATVTGCGATPTDACATEYLGKLAQKAYRRPLTAAEQTRLTTLYTTALKADAGATINEAVQYSVYALMQAPQFVYRTELGGDWRTDGSLDKYELASMLSYFLTDSVPDPELAAAAEQNKLSTEAEIGAHVDRILGQEAARANLQGAMVSYFAYPNLETQVIQDPAFTGEMRKSMFQEAKLFLRSAMWGGGALTDLLISRKGYVNETLAPLYGVQFPPAGATLDADKFAQIELPANRTGMLTQVGFLANRSRPNDTSVVGRGLLVKAAFLCTDTPPPPDNIKDEIDKIAEENKGATQRKLSEIRTTTAPCSGCHGGFDAYGVALDTFDVLGRYRDKDAEGRPIDPSVTLPQQVGGGDAKDIVEVAQKLAATGAFAKCMGVNLVNYALADTSSGSAKLSGCAAERIAEKFNGSEKTFPALIKAISTSTAFSSRSKGSEGVVQ
jgi:hypothetical protein